MTDSQLLQEAGDGLIRYWVLAAIYLAMARLCALGIRYAYTMDQGGGVVQAKGRVVALATAPAGQRQVLATRFEDRDGVAREIRDWVEIAGAASIGDRVTVIYNPEHMRFARVVSRGERWLRGMFVIMTVCLIALSAGLGLTAVLIRRRRLWLLRNGEPMRGEAVRLRWRKAPGIPGLAAWRLRASWRENESANWREVVSPWQAARRWSLAAKGKEVEILVDPRRPRRAWLVRSPLRLPAPAAANAAKSSA